MKNGRSTDKNKEVAKITPNPTNQRYHLENIFPDFYVCTYKVCTHTYTQIYLYGTT